tara:strand:+ start:33003 stop:33461 length:459 start_codon:yes stop_codon:yes gene_type:complete
MTTQHSRLKRIATTISLLAEAGTELSCVQLADALTWILDGTSETSELKLAPSNTWDAARDTINPDASLQFETRTLILHALNISTTLEQLARALREIIIHLDLPRVAILEGDDNIMVNDQVLIYKGEPSWWVDGSPCLNGPLADSITSALEPR